MWSEKYGMRKDGSSRWLIGHWYWWRHNHGADFWPAVSLTFQASIWWPLQNVKSRIYMRTLGRWRVKQFHYIMRDMELEELREYAGEFVDPDGNHDILCSCIVYFKELKNNGPHN